MYAASPATDLRFEKAVGLQLLNMNPPHFHLLVLPLAPLPPIVAVTVWMTASVLALAVSLALVAREVTFDWTPTRLLVVALASLVFSSTQAFFGTGQLSLLLLLAVTLCWRDARRSRWLRAGAWLGVCLAAKPFFLIFLPYLVGTRRFRALGVALAVTACCFAAGLVVFGAPAYAAWYGAMRQSGDWAWTAMNASTFGVFRRAFGSSPYYAPVVLSPRLVALWLVPAGFIGVVTLAVTITDTTTDTTAASTDRAFGLLLVAAQLISPLGWIYYLWLPAGPVAAIARDRGIGPGITAWVRRGLLAVVVTGCIWPMTSVYVFQPHAFATLTVGSVYFWATVCGWAWLAIPLLEWPGARVRPSGAGRSPSSEPDGHREPRRGLALLRGQEQPDRANSLGTPRADGDLRSGRRGPPGISQTAPAFSRHVPARGRPVAR
jgi:alpha-1,2-mannosyltransferase